MKKILLFGCLMFGLIIIVLGQVMEQTQSSDSILPRSDGKVCGPATEGLQICTVTPSVTAKPGEAVYIAGIIQNVSQGNLVIPTVSVGGLPPYDFKVTAPNGDRIFSVYEKALQKKANGLLTKKEAEQLELDLFPLFGRSDKLTLMPQKEMPWGVYINKYYDFTTPGKYKIEVSKKLPRPENGDGFVVLGAPIEVEVKELAAN